MSDHYLEAELRELLVSGAEVFDFIDNASLDGVWFWDLENPEHEWMSDRFWTVLGVDPSTKEHLAKEWQDLIFAEDLPACVANLESHCANPEHPYDQIVRYRHAEGHTVWVRCRGLAIRDASGKPVRMFGAHNDITDLFLAREKLSRDYSTVVEKAAAGIAHVAQDGRFVSVNEQLCEIVGLPREKLLACTFQDITHPDDLDEDLDHVRALLAGERDRYSMEKRYFHSSGRTVWINLTVAIVRDEDPEKSYFISVITDISRRKDAERKLAGTNRLLKQFAYSASHDLKAPLRGIHQLSSWIRDDLAKLEAEIPSEVLEHLDLMTDRAQHLQTLLDGLLEFSRIGMAEERRTLVDSRKVLKEVEDLVLPPSFALELGDDLPVFSTSEVPFRQIFMNLIANAVQHHDRDHGTIRVTCELDTPNREYCFRIVDDGPGIPTGIQDKVFGLFQTGASGTEKSGLGLALVSNHLAFLGGSIRVKSDPDAKRGTEFIIRWPALSEDADSIETSRSSDSAG